MSKKYAEKAKLVDRNKYYNPTEAMELLPQTAWTKFVESVDLAVSLNVDIKKGNLSIRGTVDLPHGSGKKVKIAVITKGDKIKEALSAGAEVAGAEDLIDKISKGFLGFDVLIATPDMMPQVGKLGKMLGTKGLMPNPKSGTVTPDIKKTVSAFMGGRAEFRMDKGGVVHMLLGKANYKPEHLLDNFKVALEALKSHKPGGIKGSFFKSVTVSTSMGPGIRVDTRDIV